MSLMGILEIFLALASIFALTFFLHEQNGLPKNWPLVGMLPSLLHQLNRVHDWCTEILRKSQCTFLLKGPWLAEMDMLVTADPANIHYIMSTNFSNFPKGSEFKEIFDVLGDGIFNSDFELWRDHRKVAHMLVNQGRFKQFLVESTKGKVEIGLIPFLENASKQGLVVDLQDVFQRFTFDATCLLVTGHDPGCLSTEFPEVAFSKAMDDVEEAIFYRHVVPGFIWKLQRKLGIGEEKKLNEAWCTLDEIVAKIISKKKKDYQEMKNMEEEEKGIDLLSSYMSQDNKILEPIYGDKFLRDTVLNFMLAGRDTTSAALTWFFWLVSRNPGVETKIRDELQVRETPNEPVKFRLFEVEEVKGLAYLHGGLCESLRLYPPVPFQHKSPIKLDTLPSGHQVNTNMKVLFPLYSMARMESIWGEDCLEFKPERWISDRGGIKHEPSYKFLAFNAGPRTCLGKEVAFTQMKAVAAAIIYNYHFYVVDGQNVSPSLSIILHMKHGLKVCFSSRWD